MIAGKVTMQEGVCARAAAVRMLPSAMDDAEVAIAVVGEGAEQVRRPFGTPMGRVDKGAGDFATDADFQAEDAMLSLLRRECPADGVIAEESGRSGPEDSPRVGVVEIRKERPMIRRRLPRCIARLSASSTGWLSPPWLMTFERW